MFGWGLLARRLDAVPRGLPPARALVTAVVRRAAWLRAGGGSLAPPPTTGPRRARPIGGGWPRCAGTVPAPALRHAAQLLLHCAHGPLLPGAPICSSSSRPLLVAHVVVAAVVAVVAVVAVNPLLLRFPRITATSFPSLSRSVNPGPEAERDGVSPRASSLLPSASPARSPRPINGRRVKVLSARTATDWIESWIDALSLSLFLSHSFFSLFLNRGAAIDARLELGVSSAWLLGGTWIRGVLMSTASIFFFFFFLYFFSFFFLRRKRRRF